MSLKYGLLGLLNYEDMTYLGVLSLEIFYTKNKCISCGKCKKVCPMDVDMTDNSRKRTNGTDCILCFQCIDECPQKSLHI